LPLPHLLQGKAHAQAQVEGREFHGTLHLLHRERRRNLALGKVAAKEVDERKRVIGLARDQGREGITRFRVGPCLRSDRVGDTCVTLSPARFSKFLFVIKFLS
jgi:hypothetical protein